MLIGTMARSTNKMVARGSVTLANMRLSGVDGGAVASGGAFVDFGVADVLTGKLGCLLKIKSSNGAAIQGIIKGGGTGETLSPTELFTNPSFSSGDSGWTKQTGWTIADQGGGDYEGVATTAPSEKQVYQTIINTFGVLRKQTVVVTDLTLGSVCARGYDGVSQKLGNVLSAPGISTLYITGISGNSSSGPITQSVSNTLRVDDLSCKRVLTPSATGCTIVNSKGGVTYNWINKSALFNWNDAAGYTYEIFRIPPVIVDSDAVLNADATINLTDGSATWSATGIDDSAYLNGKYMVAVYDATGIGAFGYYKSAGAGAVVNTKGGATQNWIYVGAGFSTAGAFTRKVIYVGD